ncbi:hypothetical protein [Mesorhizobium japonicum]|uniref:Mll0455 protein n=1 Tax=Mesorhizobium japonicum (strain LMG 29417 / CECT 9101 / MAFF 303099) TaxID=266835 RepID=Q98MS8_RHILO|nr:hypothetical protein [Mesorhizobium japonicum]BAB48035.1 mll0455 [Mesorhizobium japonicum MAFF 303099]
MAYVPHTPYLGLPPIASTIAPTASTLSLGRGSPGPWLGDIITAQDPVYGVGEFIYLLGVAGTIVGSLVTFDGANAGTPTWQTALAPSTANLNAPLAVAMSANVAGQYGWYQLFGSAVVATNGTLAAGPGPVYLAGSGQVTSTQANGKQVVNARNETATGTPAAGLAVVKINYPYAQGQIV